MLYTILADTTGNYQIEIKLSFSLQLTLGDLFFLHASDYIKAISPQALDKFPELSGLFDRIVANPKIAEWRAKRPVTEF